MSVLQTTTIPLVPVVHLIVYQILFSDVQDHLKEYATLKAMGYTHGYLSGVVLQEAIILALLVLFGLPLWAGTLITGLDTFTFLASPRVTSLFAAASFAQSPLFHDIHRRPNRRRRPSTRPKGQPGVA